MAAAADLALVLALDGSASVTYEEFGLMAGGMAAALRDPEVVSGLTGGRAGASLSRAAAVVRRGRAGDPGGLDAHRLGRARRARSRMRSRTRRAWCGRARPRSARRCSPRSPCLATRRARATRQVVDVIGDGRSNDGIAPGPIRDRMAASGITINGLCVLHEEPDLLESYRAEVIGGPDCFALLARTMRTSPTR